MRWLLTTACLCTMLPGHAARAQTATLHPIGRGSADASFAYALSDSGMVVGTVRAGVLSAPFRWTETSGLEILPRPSFGAPVRGSAINNAGTIAGGGYLSTTDAAPQAISWSTQNQIEIVGSPPSLTGAIAEGITDEGSLVGVTLGPPGVVREQAFIYRDGAFSALGASPSAALAIGSDSPTREWAGGWSGSSQGPQPTRWDTQTGGFPAQTTLLLPQGGVSGVVNAVTGSGSAAGSFRTEQGLRGVFWTEAGDPIEMGLLAQGTRAIALGTNSLGDGVGFCDTPAGRRAFYWSIETGILDLNTLLGTADASEWELNEAHAINNNRQIVGFGTRTRADGSMNTEAFRLDAGVVLNPDGCGADLNDDSILNIDDVLAFLSAFGQRDPSADFDHSGTFDIDDVLAYLSAFGAGCT